MRDVSGGTNGVGQNRGVAETSRNPETQGRGTCLDELMASSSPTGVLIMSRMNYILLEH